MLLRAPFNSILKLKKKKTQYKMVYWKTRRGERTGKKSDKKACGKKGLETFWAPVHVKQKCFWKIICIPLIYTLTHSL
jgi:hypothetical protein